MELLEVQLTTTAEGQVGRFTMSNSHELIEAMRKLATLHVFQEIAIREEGQTVWSVLDPEQTPCDKCQTLIPTDIHAEEMGMCVQCSNAYYDEADN